MKRLTILGSLALAAALTLALVACKVELETGNESFNKIIRGTQAVAKAAEADKKAKEDFTAKQKYYIGRAVGAEIVLKHGVYEDSKATRYLNELGQTLALLSDKPEVYAGYRFVILDDPGINAYAVPGAFVFVTRGLLKACETESELAGVLAHEISHIQVEDPTEAIKKDRGDKAFTQFLVDVAKIDDSNKTTLGLKMFGDVGKGLTNRMLVQGYNHETEHLADVKGAELMARAGYPQSAMVSVLERLKAKLGRGSAWFGGTHPAPDARAQRVKRDVKPAAAPAPNPARQKRFDAAMSAARAV